MTTSGPASGVRRGLWWWPWAVLAVVAAGAAVADAWGIASDGLETYYAAAVRAMAGSWHDFAFGAFDPRGLMGLDKLPGPFWVQALSVRAFGLSAWALVLPQVVWSVLTVVAVFVSVRRAGGPVAGLAAAVLVAVSPVTVLAARGNVGDPLFVLLCVLAADAVLRGAGSGGARFLVLAAVWLGLAFQVKMAEAWLVAGVLAAAYLVAGPAGGGVAGGVWRRAARLGAAAPVLAAVSLGWMVFVALTPARDRPYADGSAHNSVFAQVFDYNGLARFGATPSYGLGYLGRPTAASLAYLRRAEAVTTPVISQAHPAWERLLSPPVAQLTGWLLVPALVVALVSVVAACRARGRVAVASVVAACRARGRVAVASVVPAGRARGPEARAAQAPLLTWGLWLLAFAVVFSVSGGVQSYYLAILSPAIAALCALGGRAAVHWLAGRPQARGRQLLAVGAGTLTALCSAGVLAEPGPSWRWAAAAAGGTALMAGAGAVYLIAAGRVARRPGIRLALCLLSLTAAALTGPLIADGWLIAHRAGPFDTLLGPEGTFADPGPSMTAILSKYPGYGGTILPVTTAKLWEQVQAYGQEQNRLVPPGKWFAVYGGGEASDAVLGGARRVLPIGGYTGLAPSPAAGRLTTMLARNEIMFALIPGPADPRWNDPRVRAIVRWCRPAGRAGDHGRDPTAAAQVWDCRRY